MKTAFRFLLISMIGLSLTGCWQITPNPKFQISGLKTCNLDGTPNFVLTDAGRKSRNPFISGKTWWGGTKCEHKASAWGIQTGVYHCYNPEKNVSYGCPNE